VDRRTRRRVHDRPNVCIMGGSNPWLTCVTKN
jgi:hypothetical protein